MSKSKKKTMIPIRKIIKSSPLFKDSYSITKNGYHIDNHLKIMTSQNSVHIHHKFRLGLSSLYCDQSSLAHHPIL